MNDFKAPDLKDFKCINCHACCRETGYVRLKPQEPDAIAAFLGMEVHEFIDRYTRLTWDRHGLSLTETSEGACIFLTDKGCRIQGVKPAQCRDFPHKWKFRDFASICGWARAYGWAPEPAAGRKDRTGTTAPSHAQNT